MPSDARFDARFAAQRRLLGAATRVAARNARCRKAGAIPPSRAARTGHTGGRQPNPSAGGPSSPESFLRPRLHRGPAATTARTSEAATTAQGRCESRRATLYVATLGSRLPLAGGMKTSMSFCAHVASPCVRHAKDFCCHALP
eukprot:365970-Chlamydomonas_euryale.AAC.7